jgi:hypothetical protein
VKASALAKCLDRFEHLGFKTIPLQHALDRRKHAGVVVQDNYPFLASHC